LLKSGILHLQKLREELRTLNGDEAEALESSDDESETVAFRNRLARKFLFTLSQQVVHVYLCVHMSNVDINLHMRIIESGQILTRYFFT